MRGFLLGLLIGLLIIPIAVWIYFRYGSPPVAVDDKPFPFEQHIVNVPLDARIDRDAPKQSPIEASTVNLESGARVYVDQCAGCHGFYGQNAAFGKQIFPGAPQLWAPHGNGIVGVSDDPAGETYWKVANGIRLSAMPEFRTALSETEMWQVSLLLANAAKPMPGNVLELLKPGSTATPAQ